MNKNYKLDKSNIEDVVDLTSLQEGILFHYLKDVNKNLYFVQLSLEIHGEVKLDFFQKAWNKLIANNEMLRTVYRWEKLNKPVQVILKENNIDIRYYDLSKEENIIESEYQKIKIKDFLNGLFRQFNLTAYVDFNNEIVVKTLDNYYGWLQNHFYKFPV